MNLETILGDVTKLANSLSAVIPQAGLVAGAAGIGSKVIDIIDSLSAHAPPQSQEQMQAARAKLAQVVKDHAARTSDDLRGKG